MRLRHAGDTREFEIEIEVDGPAPDGGAVKARIDGRDLSAERLPLADGGAMLTIGERRVRVYAIRRGDSILIAIGPLQFELTPGAGRIARRAHGLVAPEIAAPMPGKVLKILVKEGERVAAGQPLIVMEAMKMETTLSAESPAIVKKVRATVGRMVDHGDVLIELSPVPESSPPQSAPAAP
jgi:acetyl/propionyl-CoA carboxylase alpha subunit